MKAMTFEDCRQFQRYEFLLNSLEEKVKKPNIPLERRKFLAELHACIHNRREEHRTLFVSEYSEDPEDNF
ncbi:hypothetical protein [Pantoea coffeiphila]|uniref:Uncharacterized protein n=1 Tax=Pantoea coffeiphila TaxID=1465635 RepID=A0A2S9I771_9GAMM|nr:hypothetical protein [Pantoea coffeiphila]PRD13616.1 hypothetical protein CQW29_20430 [Pantoea coffeiphila]